MLKQLKAYKFRLNPSKHQKSLINQNIGAARFLYNKMLEERQNKYKNQDKTPRKTEKEYKNTFEFLKQADSTALQQARIDLQTAYDQHFKRIKKGEKSSLKFKSKKNPKNSYRSINVNNSIKIENNQIKLPKVGWVKFKKHRQPNGKIKSVTVSKNILGRYSISLLVEEEIEHLPTSSNQIALDLGIKDYLTDSNGNKVANPKFLKKISHKLDEAQRKLSKKVKGSNRHHKQKQRINKLYDKLTNARNDFLQKLSTRIIHENQVIIVEDLSVESLVEDASQKKQRWHSKAILDCSWSRFVNYLSYKSNWFGRQLIKVDRYFASSQLCSSCGHKNSELKLSDRNWVCNACGCVHDRDYNAAKNLLVEGLNNLAAGTAATAQI